MSYYVTVIENGRPSGRVDYLAGPYLRHGDAVRRVDECRRLVSKLGADPFHAHAYGTVRVKTAPAVARIGAGKLNDRLGAVTP